RCLAKPGTTPWAAGASFWSSSSPAAGAAPCVAPRSGSRSTRRQPPKLNPVSERRLAVIDLGSNSFRLVVFTWVPGRWWKRTDEIHESVRLGEGLDASGALQEAPMERALETIELYAHFCRATRIEEVRPVATSAIRDATNRDELLRKAHERAGLEIQVLSREEEAYYGYLATVNSTSLVDGVAL